MSDRVFSNNRYAWAAFAFMAALLTAVYWNHFDNDFHFDDAHTIVGNSAITDIGNLPLFFKDAQTTSSLPTNQAYRPVITSLNAIDYWMAGGLDPKIFHLHIFLEFLIFLALLFVLLRVTFAASGRDPGWAVALFGTAFFAFHTATAETINYIIARSDGFSTLMILAGFLIHTQLRSLARYLALIPLVIGCLAKPTTLMLAPLVFAWILAVEKPSALIAFERTGWWRQILNALVETLPYLVVGLGMYLFTRSMFSETWTPSESALIDYLRTQPWVILVYLKAFILPTQLTADTDLGLIYVNSDWRVMAGLTGIIGLVLVSLWSFTRRSTIPIGFGIAWFFIALIPSSSIVPLAEVMNHHRTFFPYIGLVMAVSWALYLALERLHFSHQQWWLGAIIALFLGAHAWGTWQRNEVWDNAKSLWQDVSVKSPKNGRGLMNYGLELMRDGEYDEAIEYYQQALETDYGTHPYLYFNLGIAMWNRSELTNDAAEAEQAEYYLRRSVELGPNLPATHYFFARWLTDQGRDAQAISHLHQALILSPSHKYARELLDFLERKTSGQASTVDDWINQSLWLYQRDLFEDSIDAAKRALEMDPQSSIAYNNMCAAFNRLKQFPAAIDACRKALEIDPDFDRARANLQWAESELKATVQ